MLKPTRNQRGTESMSAQQRKTVTLPKEHGEEMTNLQESEHGFKAPKALGESLQKVLVDFMALELVTKQAHWNIVGANFRDLHLALDEIVAVARTGTDTVAERMRALHVAPDGRPSVVAARTRLKEFPDGEIATHDAIRLMVQEIETAVKTMRDVHDTVDEADPTSADILHEFIAQLEQHAWFLGAELRTPNNSPGSK